MNLIQLLLIAAILAIFSLYFLFFHSKVYDKLIVSFIAVSGIFFILSPDSLTTIANYVGIGRGTDLMIYLFILLFFFLYVIVFAKLRKVDKDMTRIIRNNALRDADHVLKEEGR